MKRWLEGLWQKFRPAFEELIVHFLITVVTLASLAGVEWTVEALHLAEKVIPKTELRFSDWMFYLDALAVTVINVVGVYKALRVVLRSENEDE